MKQATRDAIYNDRPVMQWVASVYLDGKTRKCWN